jgi:hypothetical protein
VLSMHDGILTHLCLHLSLSLSLSLQLLLMATLIPVGDDETALPEFSIQLVCLESARCNGGVLEQLLF